MMNRLYNVLLVILLFPFFSSGQISVAVDSPSDSIKFADELVLNYKINIPQGVDVTSIDFGNLLTIENAAFKQDSINFDKLINVDILDGGAFGISESNLIVTKDNNGQIATEGKISIRISSIGAFLPPIPKIGHISNASEIPLQRKPIFVLPHQVMELNANRDIIEETVSWWDWGKWLTLWLSILGIGYILYRQQQNRKRRTFDTSAEKVMEPKLPAHEIALAHLKLLKNKQLWQNGQEKEYHSELTRIMRQYVEDRYEVTALEMTTSELNRSMAQKGIDKSIIIRLVEILQIADKVKFAKGKTGPEINESFYANALQMIEDTKILYQEEQE